MSNVVLDQPVEKKSALASPGTKSKKREEREQILSKFHKEHLNWKNVDWVVLVWMAGIHIGAVAALSSFPGRPL